MAIRLDKVFGGSAQAWYRLQASYDIAQALKSAGEIQLDRLWPEEYQKKEQVAA